MLRVVAGSALALAMTTSRGPVPDRNYFVYVGSESADMVALVKFGPDGAKVERQRYVGASRAEIAGPHGVALSPDGRHYYVSIAHGVPNGFLQKYSTATDSAEGNVMLGSFPATLQVSPDGYLAYVVNFNLHGDMVPSTVSVVATAEMAEIARVETCTMPHGSRLTKDGTKHYSACMMDEMLVELDTRTLAVSRHFRLTKGKESGMNGAPTRQAGAATHDMGGHGMDAPKPGDTSCQPTWALPTPSGSSVYVACNKSSEIVEIDGSTWTLKRRIAAGPGVYNLALTHNGAKLIATNKRGQSVSVFSVAGEELARITTTRAVVHGVAVSDDDRYAFITMEGRGAEPGAMDVIDLKTLTIVARVDLGQQAGGIDFWRSEPVSH